MAYYHFVGEAGLICSILLDECLITGRGGSLVLPAVRAMMLQDNCSVEQILTTHFPLTWKTKVELIQIHQR